MGFTYLTQGNLSYALWGIVVTDIVYILVFIGAQQLKASGNNLKRNIVLERVLIFGSPIVFIAGMVAISHFWTVNSQNREIVETFNEAINSSKRLFDDYEAYSLSRINSYEQGLNQIIRDKAYNKAAFERAGFVEGKAAIQRNNMVETLRLSLLSTNYDSLKTVANKWIDASRNGASTWNAFLLGNTREIVAALNSWEEQLRTNSEKKISNEIFVHSATPFTSAAVQSSIAKINSLTAAYTTQKFPTASAIVFGVAIYLMLLFPYYLQERHAKSTYTLLGSKESEYLKPRKAGIPSSLVEDSRYPAFTLNNQQRR